MGNSIDTSEHTDTYTETVRHPTTSGLTARQENFARAYAECGVALDAYRVAYDNGNSRASARVAAYRLLKNPRVVARVKQLQDDLAERSGRSSAALIRELEELVSADLNELIQLVVGSCRHCWGVHGRYQWRDMAEYGNACEAALLAGEPLPDASGGTGYVFEKDPNHECAACVGAGKQVVRMTNTADLSPGTRRLFRGIEFFPDGGVKRVLLHDQMAARVELHKLRGLHIERSMSVVAHTRAPDIASMTAEQCLDYLESLKPTRPALEHAVTRNADVIEHNATPAPIPAHPEPAAEHNASTPCPNTSIPSQFCTCARHDVTRNTL